MNAYPDRVRAFFIYGKMSKKHHTIPFTYCDCIETITLPKTVEFIGMNAFRYCHNLSQITINSSNCVLFGANAFYSTAEEKVFYVKKGLKKEYLKASIWTEYRDLINEMV